MEYEKKFEIALVLCAVFFGLTFFTFIGANSIGGCFGHAVSIKKVNPPVTCMGLNAKFNGCQPANLEIKNNCGEVLSFEPAGPEGNVIEIPPGGTQELMQFQYKGNFGKSGSGQWNLSGTKAGEPFIIYGEDLPNGQDWMVYIFIVSLLGFLLSGFATIYFKFKKTKQAVKK